MKLTCFDLTIRLIYLFFKRFSYYRSIWMLKNLKWKPSKSSNWEQLAHCLSLALEWRPKLAHIQPLTSTSRVEAPHSSKRCQPVFPCAVRTAGRKDLRGSLQRKLTRYLITPRNCGRIARYQRWNTSAAKLGRGPCAIKHKPSKLGTAAHSDSLLECFSDAELLNITSCETPHRPPV